MNFITSFELSLATHFAVFVATLVFSQKIKDWVSGVPAEVRAAIKAVEASTVGNVKAAQATVLTQLTAAVPAPPAPVAPAAPPAPTV